MKKKNYVIIGDGLECKRCDKVMERREHSETSTKYLRKAYHFTEWDYCFNCEFAQHYNEYKVLH